MKISKREKVMLLMLLVILVGGMLFMFFLKPMTEERDELEEQKKNLTGEWNTLTDPILVQFANEVAARSIWTQSGETLNQSLSRLLYNRNYILGNKITDLKGTAMELNDGSVIPIQPRFMLFGTIKEMHLDPYIVITSSYSINPIQTTQYTMPSGAKYTISTARIPITNFRPIGFDTDNLYRMLDTLESSGYIIVENLTYDPVSKVGSMNLLVLMTPGDLSVYDAIKHSCGRYIEPDSTVCKYCGDPV